MNILTELYKKETILARIRNLQAFFWLQNALFDQVLGEKRKISQRKAKLVDSEESQLNTDCSLLKIWQ